MGSNWHRKVAKKKEILKKKRENQQTPRVNENVSTENGKWKIENEMGNGNWLHKDDKKETCEQCKAEYYDCEYKTCKICTVAKADTICHSCCEKSKKYDSQKWMILHLGEPKHGVQCVQQDCDNCEFSCLMCETCHMCYPCCQWKTGQWSNNCREGSVEEADKPIMVGTLFLCNHNESGTSFLASF